MAQMRVVVMSSVVDEASGGYKGYQVLIEENAKKANS